jgi:ribosomal protein L3
MLVDAAPVTVIAIPPLVVSALRAMPQDGVLSKTVVADGAKCNAAA